MSVKTIPYGDRAILVSDNFVYVCDTILLKEDFATTDDLMAEVKRVYEAYQVSSNGG